VGGGGRGYDDEIQIFKKHLLWLKIPHSFWALVCGWWWSSGGGAPCGTNLEEVGQVLPDNFSLSRPASRPTSDNFSLSSGA
jgi:hypothetical protein